MVFLEWVSEGWNSHGVAFFFCLKELFRHPPSHIQLFLWFHLLSRVTSLKTCLHEQPAALCGFISSWFTRQNSSWRQQWEGWQARLWRFNLVSVRYSSPCPCTLCTNDFFFSPYHYKDLMLTNSMTLMQVYLLSALPVSKIWAVFFFFWGVWCF